MVSAGDVTNNPDAKLFGKNSLFIRDGAVGRTSGQHWDGGDTPRTGPGLIDLTGPPPGGPSTPGNDPTLPPSGRPPTSYSISYSLHDAA